MKKTENEQELSEVIDDNRQEATESGNQAGGKRKKPKTPIKDWPKKKKIIVGSVSGVVAVILIAVIAAVSWFFSLKSQSVPFDQANLEVDMGNVYYVGTEGSFDRTLTAGKTVKTVEGAYNVSTYDDFFQKISEGKNVVVHAKDFEMTKELGTIDLKSEIYGNGVRINAFNVVNGTLKSAGNTGIKIGTEKKALVRDLKIFGKKMTEGDNLKTFNNYGALIDVSGDADKKAEADIIHCVVENGHKVVHMKSAKVYMEGCIVRNAADTAISIGTYANQATEFTSKNNVVADSLTGGILSYCYDGNINASNDNEKTWNTINILGFLDIYNWKQASKLAFIPDTEGEQLAAAINPYLAGEVAKDKYDDMRVLSGEEMYIHFGILKIATNSYGVNRAKVLYDGKAMAEAADNAIGYRTSDFPIPSFGKNVLKQAEVSGYFNNGNGAVTPTSKITDNANLYKELREGRNQ